MTNNIKVTLAYDSESNSFLGLYVNGQLFGFQKNDDAVSILNAIGVSVKKVLVENGPTSDPQALPQSESDLQIV